MQVRRCERCQARRERRAFAAAVAWPGIVTHPRTAVGLARTGQVYRRTGGVNTAKKTSSLSHKTHTLDEDNNVTRVPNGTHTGGGAIQDTGTHRYIHTHFYHLAAPWQAIELLFCDHWETTLWGQILAGSPLEANFRHLKATGPAIKIPFWDHLETALLAQILAGSPLEANFRHLRALGPAIKIPFWDHWETALLGQILAGSLLEANFCHLAAPWPAIEIPFWDHWETASSGQILPSGSLLGGSGNHLGVF